MSTPECRPCEGPGPLSSTRKRRSIKLAPSILSADFARLGLQVAEAEANGADLIHVDVMDGHFVPNISIGPMVVEAVRHSTALPLDVHLMIEQPERYVECFARAGADILTVHVETSPHVHRLVQMVHGLGKKAGVSLNPASAVGCLEEIITCADLVLVMTVNPGFGGQEFIPSMLNKIARVRAMVDERGLDCDIEVDGGINPETAGLTVRAGANILVAGAAVFASQDGIASALARLRRIAEAENE